jgi:Na+/H+ antiporter NhaA
VARCARWLASELRPLEHVTADPDRLSERTAWVRRLQTPLRAFLRTESGGGAVLLAAIVLALIWANLDAPSYRDLWETELAVALGDAGVALSLREWVNSGLMTFFFFVLGLEARREFDIGELRERRRFAMPMLAAVGGMGAAVGIYLAFNVGSSSAQGWGVAMSTDTALALGLLALVGRRAPERLRAFVLTVVVVDDLLALVVIGTAYTEGLEVGALLWACGFFAVVLAIRAAGVRRGPVYFVLGLATWIALLDSGVEPVVVGLAMGLAAWAYPPVRSDLEQAADRFREFREQPTPELERHARASLSHAISPNERLLHLYHPWSSYVVVPLFAFANAGIDVDWGVLERAAGSSVTLGIVCGYVVGKPLGVVAATVLVARTSRRRLRPPVGWAAVLGAGAITGIGFTVSLLIATLAFSGPQLEEAKLGILVAVAGSSGLTWLVFRLTSMLPWRRRIAALLGGDEPVLDLAYEVDPERDYIRGPLDADVTVVEYGDFECPYCGRAEVELRGVLRDFGDVRFVWRHLPLTDVHPHAEVAAEASEAAAAQGAFWPMHDLLLEHQEALEASDLVAYAERLGLDVDRFKRDLRKRAGAHRIAEDVEGADLSGVSGTPTLFVNGRRHRGAYDSATLSRAVETAGARAKLAT